MDTTKSKDHYGLAALFIARSVAATEVVHKSVIEYIPFGKTNSDISLYNGLVSLSENDFDVCFIHDEFPEEDLQSFFSDFNNIQSESQHCLFIQVRDLIPQDFDRQSLKDNGFVTVVAQDCQMIDINSLTSAIKPALKRHELRQTMVSVEDAFKNVLEEVDRVALDWKRGFKRPYNTITAQFINMQTALDTEILDQYYDRLVDHCIEVELPEEFVEICIPDEVLRRNLPKLSKTGYDGVSKRVWAKMKQRHGAKDDHDNNNS